MTWSGQRNTFNIVGISENNGIVNFNVMYDGNLQVLIEDFESMPVTTSTSATNVEGDFATWSFNKAGVRAPGEGKADGENSVLMKLPSQFYSTTPLYYDFYMASMTVFNPGAYVAKYTLEYSLDNGETWVKAAASSGSDGIEIASRSNGMGYWTLDLNNRQGVLFRISQVGGNKNSSTYVDNFSLYYTGKEGGPDLGIPEDVNGDGEVNIADVNAVIQVILNNGHNDAADVNGDGEINIADVNAVITAILRG